MFQIYPVDDIDSGRSSESLWMMIIIHSQKTVGDFVCSHTVNVTRVGFFEFNKKKKLQPKTSLLQV